MNDVLDRDLRLILGALRDSAPLPPEEAPSDGAQPAQPHDRFTMRRVLFAAAAAATVVIVLSIAALRRGGPDQPNVTPADSASVVDAPLDSALTDTASEPPPTPTAAAVTHQSTAPAGTNPRVQHVRSVWDLGVLLSPWSLAPQEADVFLGTTGTVDYWFEMTADGGVCIRRQERGRGCGGIGGPRWGGGDQDGTWDRHFIVAADTSGVRLTIDGLPVCDMRRFSLETYGNAAVWACEGTSPPPELVDVEITDGGTTFIVSNVPLGSL